MPGLCCLEITEWGQLRRWHATASQPHQQALSRPERDSEFSAGIQRWPFKRVAEQHVRKRRCCRAEPNRKKGQNLTPAEQLRLRNLGYGSPEAKSKGNKQKPKSPEEARKDAAHNEEDFDADKLGLLMDGTPKSKGYKLRLPQYLDDLAKSYSKTNPDQPERSRTDWEDWARSDAETDWEETETSKMYNESYQQRRRKAWENRKDIYGTPRDAFIRPMVDLQGAKARLRPNSQRAAAEIEDEFDENRWESQEALKYLGFLIGVPLLISFIFSRLVADPFYEVVLAFNPDAFELSDRTKIEGAEEVHIHEMRLRMDAALGRAPPLTEAELQIELRREAKHLAQEYKERNRQALLNVLADGTTATLGFAILLQPTEAREHFFRTASRFASGLSDTAKAFLIIAGTDILLGYHSEEGWTAALRLLSEHYGIEAEPEPIYIFVAIVPVTMDAIFKYWIFKGLNRQNPAAAATLKTMDRH